MRLAPQFGELEKADVGLAEDHRIRAGGEVRLGVVCGVRPVHRDATSERVRRGDHLERRLARVRRAHLGEEIEVVFQDPDDGRPYRFELAP